MKFDNETETILGIRPEHIAIANDQGLDAKIKNVEPMGAVTYLEIKVDNTKLTAQYAELVKLEEGMDIKIIFVEDKMLFYDKKIEKLINY
ncbi:MAG: TOBE domain-containing protein [Nitrososphaeria archaeon]